MHAFKLARSRLFCKTGCLMSYSNVSSFHLKREFLCRYDVYDKSEQIIIEQSIPKFALICRKHHYGRKTLFSNEMMKHLNTTIDKFLGNFWQAKIALKIQYRYMYFS